MQERKDGQAPGSAFRPLASGILALVVAMGIGRFAYTPILPYMQKAFGLSTGQSGLLASSNYLGYLSGAALLTVVPPRAHHHGAALRASLAATALTTGLMAATGNFAVWLGLRFLAGVASAGVFVLASGAVLEALRRRRGARLSGWLYSGVGIGIALSGLLVLFIGSAGSRGTGWRADWVSLAVLAAVLSVVCRAWLPEGEAPVSGASGADAERGLGRLLSLLWISYFLEGAGYIVSGTFLVKIVEDTPGLNGVGTAAWVLVGVAAAPSTVLWAGVSSRIGYLRALCVAYPLQAAGIALPVLSGSEWAAALSAVLFGGTFMGITALVITYASRKTGGSSRVIGLLTAAFGLGQVVGPLLPAALGNSFTPALLAAAGAALAGGLILAAPALGDRG
ncbi:YbfB/YjiJ family MFS transporter [Rubrobacter calidifluminis]|uniref:YbfB/YjiJ family MFS transporter n=1 Tax=Rubrobacter calidifluminis TaxID=1392640 RepID=UPI00235E802B|nr:YbfB/YjiJ family MFS transporter [Rubrobacter calidifluminis]